ncbi:MAG: sugar ABC transporter ATP-binding protein [Verrucomicrobia bacterium]|nr:sugar ABC transporter ATP-binding protein [Verrucomicrobiota bacterium]
MSEPVLLKVSNVGKRFPGVLALDNVSLSVGRGEVHALLGENGAGKSTLLKILAGAQYQDSGTIDFDGEPLGHELPHERQQLGIATVYQEFTLIPNLSVAENIFMGREPVRRNFLSWPTMLLEAKKVIEKLDLRVDTLTPVYALSVAEQQMVEIARALTMRAKLIILDEPTAALSDREVDKLHQIVRDLKAQGLSIIYVTHRLGEVKKICDRLTVLRDGKYAGEAEVADTSIDQIVRMMVGRNVEYMAGEHHKAGKVVAQLQGITRLNRLAGSQAVPLRNMSLEIREGEILGLAGLVGAGRTELVRALFGADQFESGTIYFEGRKVTIGSPTDAIKLGMALVPEDRKQQGLFLTHSIRLNIALPSLPKLLAARFFIDQRKESSLIESFRKALRIRMAHQDVVVGTLSGGNQQKVILARCMALKPKVLIVDEPTRGIDIGAKAEVHQLLRELAGNGTAVVVVSSELPEVISLCDRIITVKEGRITGEVPGSEATEEKLMKLMVLGPLEQHAHMETRQSQA